MTQMVVTKERKATESSRSVTTMATRESKQGKGRDVALTSSRKILARCLKTRVDIFLVNLSYYFIHLCSFSKHP